MNLKIEKLDRFVITDPVDEHWCLGNWQEGNALMGCALICVCMLSCSVLSDSL